MEWPISSPGEVSRSSTRPRKEVVAMKSLVRSSLRGLELRNTKYRRCSSAARR